MEFTGERMIPEFNSGQEMYLEHLTRYKFAENLCQNKYVLDIACGSGYGSEILACTARQVEGVDISRDAIEYAQKNFIKNNIHFQMGDIVDIPFDEKIFDVIVSFETLEHVDEGAQKKFLMEISRVLKDDGRLIISTPNILMSPEGNAFHIKELTIAELRKFLGQKFRYVELWYQKNIEASFLMRESNLSMVGKVDVVVEKLVSEKIDESYFVIAVCSNVEINVGAIKDNVVLFSNQEQQYVSLILEKDKLIKKNEQMILERDAYIKDLEEKVLRQSSL